MTKGLITLAIASLTAGLSFADLPEPIAWFDMAEMNGAKVKDASGHGRDLTLGSSVAVVDDDFVGKALKVTGQTTDWAEFACPVVTNTTIAFWLKLDAEDSSIKNGAGVEQNTIPYILATAYSGFGINYARNSERLALIDQANSPQTNFSETPTPSRCCWHHVAYTVSFSPNASNGVLTCRSYLDGHLVKTGEMINNKPMWGAKTCSAILLNSGKNSNRPTSGLFADFRFYNDALVDDQILDIVKEKAAAMRRLVLRYAFDEISATVDSNGRRTTPESAGFGKPMVLGKNMSLVDDGVEGKALRLFSLDATGADPTKAAIREVGGKFRTPSCSMLEHTFACWVRRSSRSPEMAMVSNNPYPRFINGFGVTAGVEGGYGQFSNANGLGLFYSHCPLGAGTNSKGSYDYALAAPDVWSHLAVVERLAEDGQGRVDIYVNGELAKAGTAAFPLLLTPGGADCWLGVSSSYDSNRYFCGDFDDFRVYSYALSAAEVRRVYRGLAKVDAGADFTVAGTNGVLRGAVAANAGDGYRKGFAGTTRWSLVSAPAGGEGAAVLQPEALTSAVSLPVAGDYVFRLTIADLGVSASDEVTVVCVAADAGNAAPSVSVVASAQAVTQPDSVTLTATVSDDGRPAPAQTRVQWTKKSGPGAAWFESATASSTKATFGAAGTYVLTCTADDGQTTASADVTVAVADRTDGLTLNDGLLSYWALDGHAVPYAAADKAHGKNLETSPNGGTLRYVSGKVGAGVRATAYSGTGAYWSTGVASGEVGQSTDASGTAYTNNNPPVNDYLTISAWVYVDPNDPNLLAGKVIGASVVGQSHTLGLRYNEKYGPNSAVNTDGFTLFQQGRNGSDASGGVGYAMVHFPAPNPSPKGRWTHICGILARNESNAGLWEMWYDGVKQTASSTYGNVRGRINTNLLLIGGMNYTGALIESGKLNASGSYNANWPVGSSLTDFYSRTFPGIVDEVRIWTRRLTPEEIRYLAANPVVGENRGPCVDGPTAADAHLSARKSTQVAAVAFADRLPTGDALTYRWSVVSDNAALASFGDATSASTTFTASKMGVYVLQLVVSDGERTVCSKPLTVEVVAPGMLILIK